MKENGGHIFSKEIKQKSGLEIELFLECFLLGTIQSYVHLPVFRKYFTFGRF